MSLSDSDLELLESHLDGELSGAEDEALRDRMNIEPDLAEALEALRAERVSRHVALRSMEPDDDAVERFNVRASREIQRLDRRSFWERSASRLRIASAAAACLLIGFSVGRIANSGVLNRQPGDGTGRVAVVPEPKPVDVILTDDRGRELGVQRFNSPERAREFINDIDRWQRDQRQADEPGVIRVSDEF